MLDCQPRLLMFSNETPSSVFLAEEACYGTHLNPLRLTELSLVTYKLKDPSVTIH